MQDSPYYFDLNLIAECFSVAEHSSRLLEVYDLFGFQQLIDRGTRETLTSNTLIDHIATTNKSNVVTSGVHEASISDHYMVYCVRKFRGASRRQHKNISTRQLKNFNSAVFINDLLSIDWNGIVNNNDDVNLIVEQWTSSFSLILEKHAPLRERRVSEKFCPWLTKDLKLMSAARDKLKKQAVRSNSEILMQAHRQMRNKVNKLNTESKREYFSNKIASHNGDLKNTWKTINLVLNKKSKTTQIASLDVDGKQVCDFVKLSHKQVCSRKPDGKMERWKAGLQVPRWKAGLQVCQAIAESMNDFFCNIGKNLSDKLPQTENPLLEGRFSVNEHNLRFEFQAVNIAQVEKVFGKFKKSLGFWH